MSRLLHPRFCEDKMNPIETERLILREFTREDSRFILELLNTEGWLKYVGDRNVYNEKQAADFIEERLRPSYTERGFGFFLVESKKDKKPMGMCGLVKREGLENIDLGFAFLPEYFGKGFAFESCMPVIEFAKMDVKADILDAITMPINKNSIALLERLGFNYERNVMLNEEELMLFRKPL
jgi:RimJ/RimL family protein N-acetyltransferase